MKPFPLYLILMLGLLNISKAQHSVPDLLGQYQSTNASLKKSFYKEMLTNNLNLFSGFPITGSYTVYSPKAGGIYLNMDNDPELEIVHCAGSQLLAVNIDGSAVIGWPKTLSTSFEFSWSPSAGDIDGDGKDEIVVAAGDHTGGQLYAYEQDGSMVSGFPKNTGRFPMIPVLEDISGDAALEIIIGNNISGPALCAYHGNGNIVSGWPQSLEGIPASSVAVGDLDGNPGKEIIAESIHAVYVFSDSGQILPGWPFMLDTALDMINSYSAAVVADIDNDGSKDILFGCHGSGGGYIYVMERNGQIKTGWPQQLNNWVYGAPVVANLDGDAELEILISDQGASSIPSFYIHGYNPDGTSISGFPVGPTFGTCNQICIVNLDSDSDWEFVADMNNAPNDTGYYAFYNHDGTVLQGWDVSFPANSMFQQVLFGDLNQDGQLDMVGSSQSFLNQNVYLHLWDCGIPMQTGMFINPVYQFNNQHTGFYYGNGNADVREITKAEVNLYPNPCNDYIDYTLPELKQEKSFYQVRSLDGKTIREGRIQDSKGRISLEGIRTGIYLITFKSSSMISTQKIIISK